MTHKWTRGLSWLALVLALGATIFAFTGMTLARVDRIGKLEGFSYLYQSAPVAAGALGLAIIALILNWRAGWPAGWAGCSRKKSGESFRVLIVKNW